MSGGSAHRDLSLTVTRVITGLSCAAVLLSIAASGPRQQPLPGTRTAFELLAKESTRTLTTSSTRYPTRLGTLWIWSRARDDGVN
jgi:hypothetical protein